MPCPHCQGPTQAGAQFCPTCGQALTSYGAPPAPKSDSDGTFGGMIPYKNGPALTAYYLGIFSIIPILGIPMGIAAVVLGFLGLRKQKTEPAVKGKMHAYVGIGCGGLGALGWLALFLIPFVASMTSG